MAEDFELILAVAEDAVNDTESFTKAKQISLYLIDKIQGKYAKAQGRAIVLGLLFTFIQVRN